MQRKHAMATSTAALAAAQLLFVLGGSSARAADEDTSASDGAADIVVTARKSNESLLKTPVAITGITAELIEKKGISSLNDVVTSTPGINVSNASSGRNDRSFQQVSLRGMTPSSATSVLTASFIDGVPVGSATALNTVTDPARLEVLKGPQSAYFGRNTFAGAINVVTKVPGSEWHGSLAASAANRNDYDLAGAIEGPLVVDVLTFRGSLRAGFPKIAARKT